jgi:chromosome segregation protein
MRLEKIKLSGFKSFVDPTTVPLPSNLVGIVGPNGCGKSNIIDAVRWVMGESSAKHLRGESMADVIFNGSSSRKPVGIASVELTFDNSDGKAGGEFAQYQEIALKRQVGRDGQSNYYLNGSRCRRKDITDIFLGTGLGARSYAIIEQGTISRLIEAKPDELRAVIEEAAGISKYKERRHETETRMRHTLENLERLKDVRDEVAKQIGNLQRQARKAEKYTELKGQERTCRQQLLGLRWRKYDQLLQQYQAVLLECENAFKALVSDDNALNDSLAEALERKEALQKQVNDQQGQYYELGAEISRLDQAIKHAHKAREDLIRDRDRLLTEQQQARSELDHDSERIAEIREELVQLEQDLGSAQQQEQEAFAGRQAADQAQRAWREQWEKHRSELSRCQGQVEIQRARIRQLDDQQRQLQTRRDKLTGERAQLAGELKTDELEDLAEELAEAELAKAQSQSRLDELLGLLQQERARVKAFHDELHRLRAEKHSLQGKISSLEILQQHAMGKDRNALIRWLKETGLDSVSRLAEHLDVQPGWETAVESVLGIHLEAVCVPETGPYLEPLKAANQPESVALFETRQRANAVNPLPPGEGRVRAKAVDVSVALPEALSAPGPHPNPSPAGEGLKEAAPTLLDCVTSSWCLGPLLGSVYRADDLSQAQALSTTLAEHESVVTPDGVRLGPGWLLMQKPEDGKSGVLKRERELRELKQRQADLQLRLTALEDQLAEAEEASRQAEFEREQRQSELNRHNGSITQIKSQLSAATARAEQHRKRLAQLDAELADLEDQVLGNVEDSEEARTLMAQYERSLAEFQQQAGALSDQQQAHESTMADADTSLRTARDRLHGIKSRLDTLKSTENLTLKHLERLQNQYRQLEGRLDDLSRRMNESGAPLDDEQQALETLLDQRRSLESALGDVRRKLSDAEGEIRFISENRMRKERELDNVKKQLEQTKLDYRANDVRRQTIQEQFDEIGASAEEVIPTLPEDAEEKEWQNRVTQLGEDIAKLGAINLTAMQEYEEQSERMKFLDQQYDDLTESQTTLQQAIEKIDRECRARFKETFDKVNAGIQRMFPKLFGGGQAYLEMMERDLLETGVSIMARPPGKRNSSIHLLSGGEKALTAVALVFSIFELNPAPFCLLDEVDAPLDDANVGRFSQLVKEMSEQVQFLFISHNKVTMEIAQHLAGVTMKEPGVSRIVAVDIDEAVELASA